MSFRIKRLQEIAQSCELARVLVLCFAGSAYGQRDTRHAGHHWLEWSLMPAAKDTVHLRRFKVDHFSITGRSCRTVVALSPSGSTWQSQIACGPKGN